MLRGYALLELRVATDQIVRRAVVSELAPPMSMTRTFTALARLPEVGALGDDHLHELVPGLHEGLRSLVLELGGQRVDVDPGLGELGQHVLAVAAVGRQERAAVASTAEGLHPPPPPALPRS